MNPDRRPIYYVGCVGSGGVDARSRMPWWAQEDDAQAVRALRSETENALRLGYRRVRWHMMQGALPGQPYNAELCAIPWMRRRAPLVRAVVLSLRQQHPDLEIGPYTRWYLPGERTRKAGRDDDCVYRAANEGPLLGVCNAVDYDGASGDPAGLLDAHQEGAAHGVRVTGEALPVKQAGVRYDLWEYYTARAPWMMLADYWRSFGGHWVVTEATEVHVVFQAQFKGGAACTYENVHQARTRGFIPGGWSGLTDAQHGLIVSAASVDPAGTTATDPATGLTPDMGAA